ncbi:MAG: segregation/condensation protein A [Candidatus Marinimicrobia bacterium]|nr:segregation/condensation protein A [Candidatus Neomarinimicrobiota bacterium]
MEEVIPLVKISKFEGPLDLLLYLIRQQEIDIHDIPINEITRQYLSALETMQNLNLEVAGEFILMVAYLLYIKAQMLLPRPKEEEDEDPRIPLVQKLLEYQKFKQIGDELKRMEIERNLLFPRSFNPSSLGFTEELKIDYSSFDLYKAYISVVGDSVEAPPALISGAVIDMEEKIAQIHAKISKAGKITFEQLTEGISKLHLVASFIALLELAKRGVLKIKQAKPLGSIIILSENYVQD